MNLKRILSTFISTAMIVTLACSSININNIKADAENITSSFQCNQSSDVSSVTLALYGQYFSQVDDALKLVNQYRYEACKEGVTNPSTGKALTLSDYNPIKWSYDLEYIARIRAAEADLTISHTRPNGESCFTVESPNGISSYGECLAWNSTTQMVNGIKQWYAEKSDWVNNNSNAVTGHYTQMIDPENNYVGMALFASSDVDSYWNTLCAEYTGQTNLDSTVIGADAGYQEIEFDSSYVGDMYMSSKKFVSLGSTSSLNIFADIVMDGSTIASGLLLTDSNVSIVPSTSGIVSTSGSDVTGKSVGKTSADIYLGTEKLFSINIMCATGHLGDVNSDNNVNAVDAIRILQMYANRLAGIKTQTYSELADVNFDDTITSTDAIIVLQFYAGKLANVAEGNLEDNL